MKKRARDIIKTKKEPQNTALFFYILTYKTTRDFVTNKPSASSIRNK